MVRSHERPSHRCEVRVSPTRRRKRGASLALVLSAVAITAVAAIAAFVIAPRVNNQASSGPPAPSAATTSAAATPLAQGAAATTTSAPYTIKPEPRAVATDAPVKRSNGQVDVMLTYAKFDQARGTVQASGFVAGIIEDGGRCTLTLTQGARTVTATSTAAADATTTTCGRLETPPGIAAGTWNAVLTYESAHARGASRSMEVTVR